LSRIAGILGRGDRLPAMLEDLGAGARGAASGARGHARGSLGWHGLGDSALGTQGDWTCALDGAIFNRGELGERAAGDAALLAGMAAELGVVEAVRRINGEFAAALWHAPSRTLWLARDRMGVRPLYYTERADDGFAFASRPRPLLRLPGVGREPDRRFLGVFAGSHYRYFDNRPETSPYRDVRQLPAAHVLRVRDRDVLATRYWDLAEGPDLDGPTDELAERYRELLLDAVRLRMPDRGAAFTLSGGLDSSTVLSSAVAVTGEKQHAYSTLYTGSEYDESDEIRSMLDSAVAEWHQVGVDAPDVLATVQRMIEAHDEPVATATWLSHYVLCERVGADGFTTLFGGLGGDELNAGEYEYFFPRFADLRWAGDDDGLEREVEAWVRHHDHPVFRKSREVMEESLRRTTDPNQPGRNVPDRARLERYADALAPGVFDLASYHPVLDTPFASYLKNRTYQDVFRETAPCCLRAEDRQTAAFGLRNCDPLFDHRLHELMFRVPGELKISEGITKRLLREATRGLLPEETRTRIAKTGWNAPADQWFSGDGRAMVHELVSDPGFLARDVYEVDVVRRLADEHDEIVRSGRPAENHMMFFWQLVNLELWLRWLRDL
jgi:asparagine synthase (glutamine-hydrolysing)